LGLEIFLKRQKFKSNSMSSNQLTKPVFFNRRELKTFLLGLELFLKRQKLKKIEL